MAGTVNKVILVGNIGKDPEVKNFQSGDKVASFSVATSESWKDKNSGERKEKTTWHNIVVFNQNIITLCENYLKKGSKVYIEGQLETRSWEQNGEKKYATEIVLRPYRGELTMLDNKSDSSNNVNNDTQTGYKSNSANTQQDPYAPSDLEDEIPF